MAEPVRIVRCPDDGYMVGAQREIPEDPTDLAVAGLPIIGCNRLRCLRCGVSVKDSVSPEAKLADSGTRVYSCDCRKWSENGVQALEDDDWETFRTSPDVPWECEGHPAIVLPHDIDGAVVGSQAELVTLAQRAVRGEFPPRTRAADAAKGDWLVRFRARLNPGDAAAVTSAVVEGLDDPDPHSRARALHFFTHVAHHPARERLLALLANGWTLEETAWRVLAPLVGEAGPAREFARAEALAGRGSGELFRTLAAGDPEWFLANGREMALATPPRAEELYNSFAQVPDEIMMGTAKTATPFNDARDRVRRTIAELITLDEAIERTLYPLAAWDCAEHYGARLCIFAARSWGAMLMKAETIEPAELETWNEKTLARAGRVGATHAHSQVVWMFEDDACGVWNKIREVVRGNRRKILLQGSYAATDKITAITSFVDATENEVRRGVRCRLATGDEVVLYQEHDKNPPWDPACGDEYVEMEPAWVGYLGADLATWLGIPHFDRRGCPTNSRQLEVRARLLAFAELLSSGPAVRAMGSHDDEELSLSCAQDPAEPARWIVTLVIELRGKARERVLKRGTVDQIVRYLRHFMTPRRLLAAARGGY